MAREPSRSPFRGIAAFGILLGLLGCPAQQETSPEGAAALAAPPAGGGTVHLVLLTARGDRYAFEPAEVQIRPGEVVRFVHTEHRPESVAFDLNDLPPGGAEILEQQGAAAGPLLTAPGQVFDVSFRDAPEGTYPFYSVAHAEQGMRGQVVVAAQ